MFPDHYESLGARPHMDSAQIRAAYLELMLQTHPDRRPGDPEAAERARRANVAWHVLGDPARRAAYDRARSVALRECARQGTRRGTPTQRHVTAVTPHIEALRQAAAAQRAYAADGEQFRRALRLATAKVAAAVFCVGLVLLLLAGR
ncbi:MAG: J domain-containing protein [Egibacteraceae bacterium]